MAIRASLLLRPRPSPGWSGWSHRSNGGRAGRGRRGAAPVKSKASRVTVALTVGNFLSPSGLLQRQRVHGEEAAADVEHLLLHAHELAEVAEEAGDVGEAALERRPRTGGPCSVVAGTGASLLIERNVIPCSPASRLISSMTPAMSGDCRAAPSTGGTGRWAGRGSPPSGGRARRGGRRCSARRPRCSASSVLASSCFGLTSRNQPAAAIDRRGACRDGDDAGLGAEQLAHCGTSRLAQVGEDRELDDGLLVLGVVSLDRCSSCTFVSDGTVPSRASSSATSACVYVKPLIVTPVGASGAAGAVPAQPCAVAAAAAAAAAGVAQRLRHRRRQLVRARRRPAARGTTSRSTASQASREPSTSETAVARAACSGLSAGSSFGRFGTGRAASSALAAEQACPDGLLTSPEAPGGRRSSARRRARRRQPGSMTAARLGRRPLRRPAPRRESGRRPASASPRSRARSGSRASRSRASVACVERPAHDDAAERVADADAHADHLIERRGEALEVRGAARDHDLADAQGVGLRLVELERADELARERRQPEPHRLERASRAAPSRGPAAPCRGPTARGGWRILAASSGRTPSSAGDALLERRAAPVEDAGELAGAPAGDEERRRLVADRDDDGRAVVGDRAAPLGRGSTKARSSASASRSMPRRRRPASRATSTYGWTWSRGATTRKMCRICSPLSL